MADVEFVPATAGDADELSAFLVSDTWPWNVPATFDTETAASRVAEWFEPNTRTWWIAVDGQRVGTINVESVDVDREAPVWDLRLRTEFRGRGLGTDAVRFLTAAVFTESPGSTRVEAITRQDNQAMRAVLRNCGYVQEACYRRAWPGPDGQIHDGIGYAILRHDWETGERTPVDWDLDGR